ncbi:MAG: caspase family protein [Chitinophagales bacterium]
MGQTPRGAAVEKTSTAISGRQYAVVVGISNYQNLNPLHYADSDAVYFVNFLQHNLGVPQQNIYPFYNEDATLDIMFQLDALKAKIQTGDRLFIYFSGHGDIETDTARGGLLLLHSCLRSQYYLNPEGYIQQERLQKVISDISKKNARVILIIDACHSGKFSGGVEGPKKNIAALSSAWDNEVKIFSCQPGEFSLEGLQWGNGRGLFSWNMLKALSGEADNIDVDKKISLMELQSYLQAKVYAQAKPDKQTPFVVGDLQTELASIAVTPEESAKEHLLAANIAPVSPKGSSTISLSSEQASTYSKFTDALTARKLLGADAAQAYLQQLKQQNTPEDVINKATRNLVSALLKKGTDIINPLLNGDEVATNKIVIEQSVKEMELAIELLGADHYLYPAFQSRKLFLKSVAITLTAEDAAKKENINQAIQWLNESVTLEPFAYYSYFQLGVNYYRKKLPDKAIEYFNKYKSYLPNDPDTYNNIGLAYARLGNLSESVKFIAQAVAIDSTRPAYYYNMGNVMCNAGDFVRGVLAYQKSLRFAPDDANVMFNMANAYNYLSQNDSALKYYNLVLKKYPNDAQAWQYLGNTQKNMKKYDEALKSYGNAMQLGNQSFRLFYNMACILSIKGDKDNALNFLEDALKRGMSDFVMDIYKDPALTNIRSTARFTTLMKKYAAK